MKLTHRLSACSVRMKWMKSPQCKNNYVTEATRVKSAYLYDYRDEHLLYKRPEIKK